MEALDNDLLEQLKQKTDPKDVKEKEGQLRERIIAQHMQQQRRISSLLDNNSTLPVTISEVRVLNAPKTRTSFLERICNPLLSKNSNDQPTTLLEARKLIDEAATKLNKHGIFHYPVEVYIDKPDQTVSSSTPTDLNVYFHAKERGKYAIKTGTEAGSSEGSLYGSAQLRNLFGGAESVNIYASRGTRTRSVYCLGFETPILSNPDFRWEVNGLASSALKPWASHEEVLRGGYSKVKWAYPSGHFHELGYSATWRQITSLASNASPTVRMDAGDTMKSSLSHTWTHDKRDNPLLPNRGYFLKTMSELAGVGPLRGDVGFGKLEMESQAALPIPIPGTKGDSGIAFTAGLRGGLLYPFAIGGAKNAIPSRVNDRFQLGGPTDVRGFKMSGLGPHDGQDAVGGDVYAAGGASLLFPLPHVGKDTPLRLQAFVNAGRLLALRGRSKNEEGPGAGLDGKATRDNMRKTLDELKNGLPSAAAGIGLVYAHPMARFELNFTLPLVARRGEEARKGIQFGIGVSFL